MTDCNNNTTVSELPTCDSVSRDSYIIVQNDTGACKVKIADLVLSNDNVDFYGQIEQLLNKLNEVTSTVQTNSADWSITASTVTQNKPTWDTIGDHDITNISNTLTQGKADWDNVSSAVRVNSANWEATYQTVDVQKDRWQYAYDSVYTGEQNWNQAYTIALEGVGAIHEALEIIETSPWYQTFNVGSGPTMNSATASQIAQTWSTLQLNENNWTGVYNTVKANSANWS